MSVCGELLPALAQAPVSSRVGTASHEANRGRRPKDDSDMGDWEAEAGIGLIR
jgi:hypothetical protein